MAIQQRRGDYTDFKPNKMVPAEIAIVLSGDPDGQNGQAIYVAFSAGTVKRLITDSDLQATIYNYFDELEAQFTEDMEEIAQRAEDAADDAQEAVVLKLNVPLDQGTPTYGTSGQILKTNGNGSTSWSNAAQVVNSVLIL